jgi:hypothetical protein
MFDFPWVVLFAILFWVCFSRSRRFRLCEGRLFTGEMRDPVDRVQRRMKRADLEGELAQRDALIAKLEERVRVLERIATDPSERLKAEIERLRDSPPT